GGIDLLPAPVEFVELKQKLADYRFETLTTQLVRELCNLFGLDSSLLNDPENKTYSNKTEAQKALFVNVIIPQSELFAEYFNIALSARQVDLRLRFDSSRIESLAEERERQHRWLLELYKAKAISLEELREGLGYSKR
ncbi:MAG: phage portal protein, partial [Bacteroidia bacterium]|nr:phage portal protein [Bacteroidia bacterium]